MNRAVSSHKPLVETACITRERSSTSSTRSQFIEVCLSSGSSASCKAFHKADQLSFMLHRNWPNSIRCRTSVIAPLPDVRQGAATRAASKVSRPFKDTWLSTVSWPLQSYAPFCVPRPANGRLRAKPQTVVNPKQSFPPSRPPASASPRTSPGPFTFRSDDVTKA